jgi:superfamily II DNA helicase RecQ
MELPASTESLPAFVAPPFLHVLAPHRVLLCTDCSKCYTRQNCGRHLRTVHHITGKTKQSILTWLSAQDIVDKESEVVDPPMGQSPISGLPVYPGYTCNSVDCHYLTTSAQLIRKHVPAKHGRQYTRTNGTASAVSLQSFFARFPRYFQVSNINAECDPPVTTLSSPSVARQDLDSRYALALSQSSDQPSGHEVQHISEITPWLRITNFHTHKMTFGDIDDFRDVLRLPRRQNDLLLSLVCDSVDRVVRRGLDRIQNDRARTRLHRLDAQLLNSFQIGVTSQDPIQRLDREHSIRSYIHLFQQLVCYFFRVEDDHFGHPIFKVTNQQQQTSVNVLEEAVRQAEPLEDHEHHVELAAAHGVSLCGDDSETDHDPGDDEDRAAHRTRQRQARQAHREASQRQDHARLDQLTLAFCISLIQHRLDDSSFDSAMLSFCAVLAWDSSAAAWRKDLGNYSSYLSQLIYVSQILTLLHCDNLLAKGEHLSLGEAIVAERDLWLQNSSRGPIGDMQAWRLYARAVARDTVGIAQVRWHQDGHTLVYRDITYKVSYLHDEIRYCLDEAKRIFMHDLAFNLPDVPHFPIHDLVDNWDANKPFESFIDDPRNADCLEGCHDWLYRHVLSTPELTDQVLQENMDGRWIVRPDFAHQYEMAVQHFLEFMLTILHKGSGQPARRPEMLGLRWQNTAYDKRNLFIHDGYVLFILTYHKSQNQTHASRYPVRVLLPEAGQWLIRFLALSQPFRRWISHETQVPKRVSEYLWSDINGVWSEDRMTRLVKRNSVLSVGVSTHIQAWRQIAVGIAIKWFAGTGYQADLDLHGDADDDNEGRPLTKPTGDMPEVFHHQATHAPRTGNQVYGGTINFRDGLTDAGLQQYVHASQLWHQLCEHPPDVPEKRATDLAPHLPRRAPTSLHRRSPLQGSSPSSSSPVASRTPSKHRLASLSQEVPLAKRLVFRRTPQRHRLRWSAEAAQDALQSLFGSDATYRSAAQEQMIEQIVSGRGEIVAALATSEGKSLAFMLPCRLPRAGTTVVILPLVVLKQEMFRRCTELGLPFSVWDRDQEHAAHHSSPLVFVSAERAVQSRFRAFVTGLDAREALDRIVFDESHLILTASDYRPKLKLIRGLRTLRCQFVFLSATLPPLLIPTFTQRLLLWDPIIVRSEYTFRRDLRYSVAFTRREPQVTFTQQVIQGIHSILNSAPICDDSAARVIVYTQTRQTAADIAGALGVDAYYSDSGTTDEKAAVLSRWINGVHRVVVATSAFGMGVDYPRVAAVMHVGAPESAIDFAQEIGRLGRDGGGGQSTIILPPDFTPDMVNETECLLPVEQQAMRSYIHLPRCHAATLSWFLDGAPWYCNAEDRQQHCSRCRRLGRWRPTVDVEAMPPWLSSAQERRLAIDDGRIVPEDVASVESTSEQEAAGPELVRQHVRDAARGRERYIGRLEQFQGCCFICRLLGGGSSIWHDLERCPHRQRGDFFQAKRWALREGRAGRGWLAAFTACFRCGNPQEVCPAQGSGGCAFRDVVFPAAWAFFQLGRPFGQTVEAWTGRAFPDEARWMRWIGEEREVHGMRATNAMWVAELVMERLGG